MNSSNSVHPQPLICVRDVEASSLWYRRLLGCESAHGRTEYERLTQGGVLVLQLHAWAVAHDHGRIGDPDLGPAGNGVLIWFEVQDFAGVAGRAQELGAEVVLPVHRNPRDGDRGPNHWELWLRDPDGYTVVVSSPDGSADGDWRPEDRQGVRR